jgi:hypothetical protein
MNDYKGLSLFLTKTVSENGLTERSDMFLMESHVVVLVRTLLWDGRSTSPRDDPEVGPVSDPLRLLRSSEPFRSSKSIIHT